MEITGIVLREKQFQHQRSILWLFTAELGRVDAFLGNSRRWRGGKPHTGDMLCATLASSSQSYRIVEGRTTINQTPLVSKFRIALMHLLELCHQVATPGQAAPRLFSALQEFRTSVVDSREETRVRHLLRKVEYEALLELGILPETPELLAECISARSFQAVTERFSYTEVAEVLGGNWQTERHIDAAAMAYNYILKEMCNLKLSSRDIAHKT